MLNSSQQQAAAEREAYLVQVTRELSDRLSPLETYESVEELRLHINAMAAAHEELGLEPGEAMRTSLAKFGVPQELGGSLAETTNPQSVVRPRLLPPVSEGLLLTSFYSIFVGGYIVYAFRFFTRFEIPGAAPYSSVLGTLGPLLLTIGVYSWAQSTRFRSHQIALHVAFAAQLFMIGNYRMVLSAGGNFAQAVKDVFPHIVVTTLAYFLVAFTSANLANGLRQYCRSARHRRSTGIAQ